MSPGSDPGFAVQLTYNGDPVEVVGTVNVDWDDDDETQILVSFYAKIPYE